jgi:hypothetical protein
MRRSLKGTEYYIQRQFIATEKTVNIKGAWVVVLGLDDEVNTKFNSLPLLTAWRGDREKFHYKLKLFSGPSPSSSSSSSFSSNLNILIFAIPLQFQNNSL